MEFRSHRKHKVSWVHICSMKIELSTFSCNRKVILLLELTEVLHLPEPRTLKSSGLRNPRAVQCWEPHPRFISKWGPSAPKTICFHKNNVENFLLGNTVIFCLYCESQESDHHSSTSLYLQNIKLIVFSVMIDLPRAWVWNTFVIFF